MFLWFLDLLSVAQRPYGRASEPSTFRTEGTSSRCEASIAEGTGDFGASEYVEFMGSCCGTYYCQQVLMH
jgi:hypothetical protein